MTVDLDHWLEVARRGVWLIVATTLLAGLVSFALGRATPPVYRATTKLIVAQSADPLGGDSYGAILGAERLASTYADLLTTRPVLEQAIKRAGVLLEPEALAPLISVQLVRGTQLLSLSVEHTDPALARDLVGALAQAFIEQRDSIQRARIEAAREDLRSRLAAINQDIARRALQIEAAQAQPGTAGPDSSVERLQAEQNDARQRVASLERSYQELILAPARSVNTVAVVDPAVVPRSPVKPNVPLQTALAALAGLVLGIGIVALKEKLEDRVSSSRRVSDIAGLPLLARVADVQSTADLPLAGTGVRSAEAGKHGVPLDGASSAEAYRVLCANLQVTDLEQQIRTILVTSATRGDGKTTTAANLAMTLASSGFKTLLVDADLRRPTLHRFFGLSGDQGLADLAHPDPGPIETYLQQTFVPNLRFLASGSVRGNASELLAARTIVQRLAEIRALADFVVFDGPPVLVASGSLALAPQVDGILLVAGAGHSRFTHVQETRVMLERVGARIVGVVLNRVREPGLVSYEHESGDGGDPIASADVSVDANGASTLTSSSKR